MKSKLPVIGFTGTQGGMTSDQKMQFQIALQPYGYSFEFHHGDCTGADAQAHDIVRSEAVLARIIIHPPINVKLRAFKRAPTLSPKPYLERNHDIVDACDLLIATPSGPEKMRSGTWATVRYARKCKKPIIIIYPDGSIGKEGDV